MRVQLFTALLAAASVLAAVQTLPLGAQARGGPMTVLVPLIVVLGWQLYREHRDGDGPAIRGESSGTEVAAACAWAIALPVLVATLGFVAGPALFVVAFQRVRGDEAWLTSIALAVALGAFVWVLFRLLLLQSPPSGVFGSVTTWLLD